MVKHESIIRIVRGNFFNGGGGTYKIFINGVHQGSMETNETKEFLVKNGYHTIMAKADWCRSRELSLEATDICVELEVSPTFSGKWIILVFIIFLLLDFIFDIYTIIGAERFMYHQFLLPVGGVIVVGIIFITILKNRYILIKKNVNFMQTRGE